jgi:hypothetical protein
MVKDLHFQVEQIVYVPSTNKAQKQISQMQMKARVVEVKKFLSRLFKGYTSIKAEGGYTTNRNRLVTEGVVKITSYAKRDDFEKYRGIVHKKLKSWGRKWGQESMGYEVEGDLYYIYSN